MKMLKSGVVSDEAAFSSALESLEDLSHDIYYGVQVTEDTEAVKALLCILADGSATVSDTITAHAASVLAGALSNNPTAIKAVAGKWPTYMASTCPQKDTPLGKVIYNHIGSSLAGRVVKAKVGALNGLIKDDVIRADFLEQGGMKQLVSVLARPAAAVEGSSEQKIWATAQRKVGQLALDNFLDEEMVKRIVRVRRR
jgi:nucleotide exchange factor SIL1